MVKTKENRRLKGNREKLTHRFLHYIHNRTTPKHPEWRDQTIRFFFILFEMMEKNPGLNVHIKKDDGCYLFHGSNPVAYIHFRQRHFLIHAKKGYTLWNSGDKLFSERQKGSWPRMWKLEDPKTLDRFIQYLERLKTLDPSKSDKHTRTIPKWVQEFVHERDGGRCVCCGASKSICLDHIYPFSLGGASDHPNNIQLLCSKCNGEKSANFWGVKV